MSSLETITDVLFWSSIINLVVLVFTSIVLVLSRESITKVHAKMFGMAEEDISRAYFQYLGQYKIMIFVFNLAPYIALRIAM